MIKKGCMGIIVIFMVGAFLYHTWIHIVVGILFFLAAAIAVVPISLFLLRSFFKLLDRYFFTPERMAAATVVEISEEGLEIYAEPEQLPHHQAFPWILRLINGAIVFVSAWCGVFIVACIAEWVQWGGLLDPDQGAGIAVFVAMGIGSALISDFELIIAQEWLRRRVTGTTISASESFEELRDLHLGAMGYVYQANRDFMRLNSPVLNETLKDYHAALMSKNFACLIAAQRWDDARKILETVISEVSELRKASGGSAGANNLDVNDALQRLGLGTNATLSQVKSAFRRKAKEHNLDQRQNLSKTEYEATEERYRSVIEAYDFLKQHYGQQ